MTTPCGERGNGGIGPNSPGGGAPGHNEQIAALYREHKGALFGYCSKIVNNCDTAEDIVQETFCRVIQNTGALTDVSDKKAWLFGIARNVCREYLKRSSTQELAMPAWSDAGDGPEFVAELSHKLGVVDHMALDEACNKLTPIQRDILWMRYADHCTFDKIADELDISSGDAVRKRHDAILKRLERLIFGFQKKRNERQMLSEFKHPPSTIDFDRSGSLAKWIRDGDPGWRSSESPGAPHGPITRYRIEDLEA